MCKEREKILNILTEENFEAITAGHGGPVWGATVTEEEKNRVSELSQKLSVDHK